MLKVKLNSGYEIPQLGLGTWLSKPGEVYEVVKEGLLRGVRHIDCAAIYGNEKEVGQALSETFSNGKVKREDVFITSKLWNNAHAFEDVKPAFEKTLSDLQLEYLDLYLIHWPVAFKNDVVFPEKIDEYLTLKEVPIEETWRAMEGLVKNQQTRSIGVSNFSIKKIQNLLLNCTIRPCINQVELHPYLSQNELLSYCMSEKIYLTAYCPLGSSGRPENMQAKNEPRLLSDPTVEELAKKYQKSTAQVLLNWAVSRGTIAIPKTSSPIRAKENLDSQEIKMSDSDHDRINELNRNFRYVNGDFFTGEISPYKLSELWDE